MFEFENQKVLLPKLKSPQNWEILISRMPDFRLFKSIRSFIVVPLSHFIAGMVGKENHEGDHGEESKIQKTFKNDLTREIVDVRTQINNWI